MDDRLKGMTQARWNSLPESEKVKLRVDCGTAQLKGLEGWRVEVVDAEGCKPRRFIVGKSTGWRPVHLEIKTYRSTGGFSARDRYHSVRTIRKVR